MKVAELEGVLLDYWVARAEGRPDIALDDDVGPVVRRDSLNESAGDWFEPSSNWAQGGPIIDRERMSLECDGVNFAGEWRACMPDASRGYGETPLVAAMRAYVASKFGDTVEDSQPKVLDRSQSQQ